MVFRDTNASPDVSRLGIGLQALFGVALKVGHIETVFGQLVNLCQELPRPGNGFFLA